ncbi:MAG: hypothetical protein JRG95_13355 [Deltaproteobacteria bacterium]|nr:hypothetical protein [Deltaproteobacteria bacterium]
MRRLLSLVCAASLAGLVLAPAAQAGSAKSHRMSRRVAVQVAPTNTFQPASPQWKHASCIAQGATEFPSMVFRNTDTVAFPAGSKIVWLNGGKIGEFSLTSSLAPGQTVVGPSFEAYATSGHPHSCKAVGKI